MLSKSKIKYIRSLEMKKNRKAEQAFIAEGPKLVGDLMGHFPCLMLVAKADWLQANPSFVSMAREVCEATDEELTRVSLLKAPQQVLAVFGMKRTETLDNSALFASCIARQLCLALDDVQDPGNLGTIVRIADWFGIEHIFCSPGTADVFNPKTVQATMGAIARVQVHYTPLPDLLDALAQDTPVYATLLDGDNIYSQNLSSTGLIVMGNEGNGIGKEVRRRVNRKLFIPNYPADRETSESLNVAIATSIVCAEFRRRG